MDDGTNGLRGRLRAVDGGGGDERLWHVTLTVAGPSVCTEEVREGLERLGLDHPFLMSGRYASDRAEVRPVRHERIPRQAPDWYFEAELRRSGLWEMMERCYPSSQAQSQ